MLLIALLLISQATSPAPGAAPPSVSQVSPNAVRLRPDADKNVVALERVEHVGVPRPSARGVEQDPRGLRVGLLLQIAVHEVEVDRLEFGNADAHALPLDNGVAESSERVVGLAEGVEDPWARVSVRRGDEDRARGADRLFQPRAGSRGALRPGAPASK